MHPTDGARPPSDLEEAAHVDAIGALRRRGEAQKFAGCKCSISRRYVFASAWWNSSMTTMSYASAGMFSLRTR